MRRLLSTIINDDNFFTRAILIPTNSHLDAVLTDLLASSDATLTARAENFRFEERVGAGRQAAYEAAYPPAGASYAQWLRSHGDYLNAGIFTEHPETFTATNQNAALSAAVSGPLGQEQFLIRVESLDFALGELGRSLIDIEDNLAVYHGRPDSHVTPGEAKALLHKVCESLNRNPYALRPRFAAFAEELTTLIDAPDWPLQLRDRLGLAHLPPTGSYGPHPVALMRYKIKEVVAVANRQGAAFPLAVPTVLDAEPYEVFFPSPQDMDYGRTLNLAGAGNCDCFASEVLHLRIHYGLGHLLKVGAITRPADLAPPRLASLRGDHLACLQLHSHRDNFGKP